ncbi:putative PRA1 family protein F3 [Iris pallida]|uniref:PRA1 family protein n=1 Tax=Iris pallida TaxID=29817 RepID=A0AAX6HHN8_IRIPA|nr:putative PRA1 family protein F3 [Iris pallida]
MATTYGTIPTSSAPTAGAGGDSSPLDFISRAKERGRSALSTRRPWRELVRFHAFSLPPSLGEAYLRVRKNAAHFAVNYAIVVLLVVFLSLLQHPFSLIAFLAAMCLWLFFYFLRGDDPLVLFGRVVGDGVLLGALSAVTLALLLLTGATLNILVSLLVGILVVVAHAAFRRTDDHEEEEASGPIGGGWYQAVGISSQ